jgi:hypothetical protein
MWMTKLNYTKHLENRLKLRKISHDLPQKIYVESKDRYYDEETGHYVAVMEVELYDKTREVMVAYAVESDTVYLLTVHPLKAGQKENRIQTGRWRKI